MGFDRVKTALRGVSIGLLTPFTEDSEIDYDALKANAERLATEGGSSFLAVANISEYHSLSQAERVNVAEACVEAVPSDSLVLGGVGGSTGDAEELIHGYDRVGVDAMMIMPPDHTYIHEQGLLEYYRKLGTATNRPLVPYVRGFEPSIEFLASMSELESVAGIKYALRDPVRLGAAVERGTDDVVWVNGLAEPLAVSTWAEGAEGFTAGVSNFRPEVGEALFKALDAGDWDRARRLRNICLPFQSLRDDPGDNNSIAGAMSIPAVKKGLDLAGLTGGHVREPIRDLSEAEEQRVEAAYQDLDQAIQRLL